MTTIEKVRRVNPKVATHLFPMNPLPARAQPSRNDFRADGLLYDGRELRPFEGRPGAMDFKKYPSKGL